MYNYAIIDKFIPEEIVEQYIEFIDNIVEEREGCKCSKHELQTIINIPLLTQTLWYNIKANLLKSEYGIVYRSDGIYKLIGISDAVTLSRHITPIKIHKDVEGKTRLKGINYDDIICLYKIAVYLNDVEGYNGEGGTILYSDDGKIRKCVYPKIGRALIFDIRSLHSGAPIPAGKIKYLIGFRLMYRKIKRIC